VQKQHKRLWRKNSLDWLTNSVTTVPSGRELYYLQFSLQEASPKTFGHSVVLISVGTLLMCLQPVITRIQHHVTSNRRFSVSINCRGYVASSGINYKWFWKAMRVIVIMILKSNKIERPRTRMYPKVSRLAAWSENCKWYSSLPLGAVISLFCESV
jgi:hypothetical protein